MEVGERNRCSVEGAAASVPVVPVPSRRRDEAYDVEGSRRLRVPERSESRKESRNAFESELRSLAQNVLYDVFGCE